MRIDAINIKNESQLIADYRENKQDIMQFFDYHPYNSFQERVNELKSRDFNRNELATVLEEINHEWGATTATFTNIEKLKDPESVVVIGGQQAGLLTGPLYSINKVISIIQLARQQQEKLNIPVIPVFWIAGEDHDYAEINHVYQPEGTELKKRKLNQSLYKKNSVSHIKLEQDSCKKWIDQLFSGLQETTHTNELYKMVTDSLEKSISFTDFFARVIFNLFEDSGLVLIDSAHDKVRALESEYFIQLIENQQKISRGVSSTTEKLHKIGYPLALDADESDGHLFYHQDNERILLQRTESGDWKGKQDEMELTTEELLDAATNHPESLSNNVVTRPLMQEMLFPTLAFIGGPGEISYWAALKPAFHSLDIKMPPVLPRMSYTYIPAKVKKAMEITGIDIETAVEKGALEQRAVWLQSKHRSPFDEMANDLKQTIEKAHEPLREAAAEIRTDIAKLSEKNLDHLYREVDFLKGRMNQALEMKYDKELYQFDLIQTVLYPEGGFQERKWNPLPFLNKYGTAFLTNVTNYPCSFQEKHYAVYL